MICQIKGKIQPKYHLLCYTEFMWIICGLSRTDVASFLMSATNKINARKKNHNMVLGEAENSGVDKYSPK